MRPLGLPRWLRLRSRREFLRAQRRGEKHHTRHFLVFITPRANKRKRQHESRSAGSALVSGPVSQGSTREVTPEDRRAALQPTRLGVTVTRKVGRAHQRNRIKRLVREVFRQERARLVPGFDMVWVAKRNALSFSLEELREDFIALADRLERRASRRGKPKTGVPR